MFASSSIFLLSEFRALMFPFIFKLLPIYYKHGMEEDKGNFVAAGLMSPKRSVTLSTRGGGACEINAPRGLLASRGHFCHAATV